MAQDLVDWRAKGFWQTGPAQSFADYVAAGHSLFGADGDPQEAAARKPGAFTWPIMVLRQSRLEHNLATLAAFCRRHDLDFAPHGKTTMAPTLFKAQLDAGAWGITVATAHQVMVCRHLGVPRVLLANELLDPAVLRWISEQDGFELLYFVDSLAGVQAAAEVRKPIPVLVEMGFAGGRAGCRTAGQALEVAHAVAASPGLRLAGVAGYEGMLPDVAEAGAYLDTVRAVTIEMARQGLLPPEMIVTAGGSVYFDLVAERLGGQWLPGHRLRTVLRSGAYITHDDGFYLEKTPFRRVPDEGSLNAAIELWAQVTSTPEDGLAIANFGKRDAPFDEGFPVPLRVRRRDGTFEQVTGMQVTRMNDQHAYVQGSGLVPGDLICFGISHPCTAFDKWRAIPVVDDNYRVVDVIQTYF